MKLPDALPAPYDAPPRAGGVTPRPETVSLVQSQIDALLSQTPSFYGLSEGDRDAMRRRLTHIGAYAAELVRDSWAQSKRLGQTPLVRKETVYRPAQEPSGGTPPAARSQSQRPALARAQAAQANLQTAATGRVAEITQSTLRAIAFPTFVADLINGTFDAIIGATIKQMQAFMTLVEQVSKTVDEFMKDNITDNQARDWLVQSYPGLMRVETGDGEPRVETTEAGDSADSAALEGMQGMLGLPDPVRSLDEETINERLVPAARRKLAESRLQMLSSMVMLGLQRIVIRYGRLRATMGFHIDASDRAHAEEASSFDFSHSNTVSGFYYVAFSARTSVAYVSSQKSDSDSAINVQADLTGEVDLTFETDYLPLNRLARAESIERIRSNTPNPSANTPNHSATMVARGDTGPSAAQVVSDRMTAHGAEPAPTIDKGLIDAAAGAGRAAIGMGGGG
ncbi:MAG: hypothetical protein KDJ78_03435 [Rhodobacteraceae bacterium]|uniref:hypothetical protein n=1 Tax=Amaricoccus sp. TaxID=1872485 RepID=UPI001D6B8466|nr:hypothetical protein [Amaricoccus sp.]MCB1373222.1 hypothetical protein [Paracoccaceae bacterium]MCB1404325.1 hypothetical protein [Paracoccaceae bacterium]MCC0067527.1 hypothetical protein [Rhodovulum sp.]HRW14343.1 hypothetical protein [Amaricoccus sp.]